MRVITMRRRRVIRRQRKQGSSMKKALITGVTGQDGSYLAEFLLAKGYEVHGLKRRASSFNTARVDHLYRDLHEESSNFRMHYADMTDTSNLVRLMQQIEPDEVYNLAAQSHVQVSFECPEYTAESVGVGVLRLLEAIRILDMKQTRFYQASSKKPHNPKRQNSIRVRPTAAPNSTPIGSSSTIAKPTAYTPATAYCLTTKARAAAKHSSRAKSPWRPPTSP